MSEAKKRAESGSGSSHCYVEATLICAANGEAEARSLCAAMNAANSLPSNGTAAGKPTGEKQ